MTKNNEFPNLQMKILDLGTKGEAIGKVDGFTYFVKGAIPEDVIEFKPLVIKKNFGIGKLIRIITPSAKRVAPKCAVASRCGGCQIQEMAYQEQLKYKNKKITDSLERIGKITCPILPIIGMEEPYHYRNKTQFVVGQNKNQVQIGLYSIYTHNIVDIETCHIMPKQASVIIQKIKTFLKEKNISIYHELKHQGLLRHVIIRTTFNAGTPEFMVILVINGQEFPKQEELVNLLQTIPGVISLAININLDKGDSIYGSKTNLIWGEPYLTEVISGIKFLISPRSFFQINPVQSENLIKVALDFIDPKGNELVLDAYSGIGLFSLALSKKVKLVIGIEILEEAILDAQKNAELNGIENAEFILGNVEEALPKLVEKNCFLPNIILIDPPRKGCEKIVLETIIKIAPEKIVYVSCNPDTLARDLAFLCMHNYKVAKVQPIDMFPHTVHIESVCLLVKTL